MSAAVRPTPRRAGWAELPVRCVRAPDCTGRVKSLKLTPFGALQCARCGAVMYVLAYLPLHVAFVAETDVAEMLDLNARQCTAAEILTHFGTAFPYLEP